MRDYIEDRDFAESTLCSHDNHPILLSLYCVWKVISTSNWTVENEIGLGSLILQASFRFAECAFSDLISHSLYVSILNGFINPILAEWKRRSSNINCTFEAIYFSVKEQLSKAKHDTRMFWNAQYSHKILDGHVATSTYLHDFMDSGDISSYRDVRDIISEWNTYMVSRLK